MTRFSVKKPFTVLVAVIIVLALGFVSTTRITTDLLPPVEIPYMMVITAYPGASPEKVESQVASPIERALGTVSGVENVYSVSAENYGMVQLEFVDGTNMDAAGLDVSNALDAVSLPEECGKPQMLELSMDMMATMYVAINRESYDIFELSDFVKQDAAPHLERVEGVANVANIGLVEKTIEVELDDQKINDVNDKILANVSEEFDKALQELNEAEEAVEEGQEALSNQEKAFGSTVSSGIFGAIQNGVNDMTPQLRAMLLQLAQASRQLADAAGVIAEGGEELNHAIEEATDVISDIADQQAAASPTPMPSPTPDPSPSPTPEPSPSPTPDATIGGIITQSFPHIPPLADPPEADVNAYIRQLQEAAAALQALADANPQSVAELMRISGEAQRAMAKITNAIAGLRASGAGSEVAPEIGSVESIIGSLNGAIDQIPSILSGAETAFGQLTQAQLDAAIGFSQAATQLSGAQQQLSAARAQYDSAREQAMDGANLDALLSKDVLSGMIYAQNFSMPAGYIDDRDDNAWLLKVGEEYDSAGDIEDQLLADIDGVGTIRLSDVATITVIDNSGESYTNLNGSEAVLMCVYKSSAAGTNAVSRACNEALEELKEAYPGTDTVVLMDQGIYITLIIRSILQSMITGALLAVLILAIFLRDIRPTFVVAISIPLSVLFALVLMYFSDLTLNMMTMSGLALGIGMLVDNSIVVMENVFRLRQRGISAPRAAVQGAKQVFGAITASTLTTICVFVPMIFTTGMVRQLLVPMALSITYCLGASLLVALTVVPASASTILRRVQPKKSKIFERILDLYGKALSFCLRVKIVPIALAIALLAISVVALLRMGIVMLPDMTSNYIEVDITTEEGLDRAASYAQIDEAMDKMLAVDGVSDIGIMDMSSTTSLVAANVEGTGSDAYGSYLCYVKTPDGMDSIEMHRICDDLENALSDMPIHTYISTSGMGDLSSFVSSGLAVSVYGNDPDEQKKIIADLEGIFGSVEGFGEVRTGIEEGEDVLHVVIDRDSATEKGLTAAGIYAEISSRLTTDVRATTVTVDGMEMDVVIVDHTHPVTKENLLDMEFTPQASAQNAGMAAAMGGDMSAMQGMDMEEMQDMASMFGIETDQKEDETEEEPETVEPDEPDRYKLSDFATVEETVGPTSIRRENQTRYVELTVETMDGYNTELLTRQIRSEIDEYNRTLPRGYSVELGGESSQIQEMIVQMSEMLALALLFVYLVMVAQFQSFLSPFIILFTIPLAFTGGMLGLIVAGQPLSMLSLMGFLILVGTVVNNGIVFVDYANQLRIGGLARRDALIATGKIRMRPILMTALTTILAMGLLIFGHDMGAQLGSGMAIVIAGGLLYATLMTLFIVPVMYDILFQKQPLDVDVGDDLDEVPDDAAEYLEHHT